MSKTAIIAVTVTAAPTTPGMTLSPSAVTISVGDTLTFSPTATGETNTNVNYAAAGGTVDATSFYTAPAPPGTYPITATSVATRPFREP